MANQYYDGGKVQVKYADGETAELGYRTAAGLVSRGIAEWYEKPRKKPGPKPKAEKAAEQPEDLIGVSGAASDGQDADDAGNEPQPVDPADGHDE